MNETPRELRELVEKHDRALFGDPQNKEKGIVEKLDEMHEFFMGAKITTKVIFTIVVTIGAIALAFTQIGKFITEFFKHPMP